MFYPDKLLVHILAEDKGLEPLCSASETDILTNCMNPQYVKLTSIYCEVSFTRVKTGCNLFSGSLKDEAIGGNLVLSALF